VSLPGEGGDVSLPGEGPHAVGIDRKANRRQAPTAWRVIFAGRFGGAPLAGIDRKANRRQAADRLAVHLGIWFGGRGVSLPGYGSEAAA
jgi:hypothetical protein